MRQNSLGQSGSGGGPQSNQEECESLVLPINLKAMTATLTKREELDSKAEKALSVLAEDLIDDVVEFACRMAKHRGSNVLHRGDVKLAFEKRLKVRVPTKMHQTSSAQSSQAARPIGSVQVLPS